MGLNIKTEEAHRLAKKIADKTGESITTAVTTALRERLQRIEKDDRFDEAWAIAQRMAARLNGPGPKMMKVEDLYDEETGLPK
jgi:antitoxin VapB